MLFGVGALIAMVIILLLRRQKEIQRIHGKRVLPPPARRASIYWLRDGKRIPFEVMGRFTIGKSEQSNIVLPTAKADSEARIFHHNQRFAIETLHPEAELSINGDALKSSYLKNGDILTIAGHKFTIECI